VEHEKSLNQQHDGAGLGVVLEARAVSQFVPKLAKSINF
jgi:hypothetical protein